MRVCAASTKNVALMWNRAKVASRKPSPCDLPLIRQKTAWSVIGPERRGWSKQPPALNSVSIVIRTWVMSEHGMQGVEWSPRRDRKDRLRRCRYETARSHDIGGYR